MTEAEAAAKIIREDGAAAFFDATDFTRGATFIANHAETGGRRDEVPIEFEDGSRLLLVVLTYKVEEAPEASLV